MTTSGSVSSKYLPGDLIHKRYRVVRLLGSGGMAEVYLTSDIEMHDRLVALKLLFSHISVDQVIVERFIREVELTQKHSHPNIVRAYHYGKTERNEQYFTMEYVEGRSLAEVIKAQGAIPYPEAFKYILQVCSALSAAHQLKIIHRDIKPDNIMLANDGQIKITDFGIAKDLGSSIQLTELEKGPKSYLYKAPELYVDAYDQRVDIYSLGITAYELLTGKLPFEGERHQLLVAHLTSEIPKFAGGKSGIPNWCQQFVEICAAKSPIDRFKDADEAALFIKTGGERRISGRGMRRKTRSLSLVGLKYLISFALGLLVVFLYAPIGQSSQQRIIGDYLDLKLLDKFFQLRGKIPAPEDILVISIDESSYQNLGLSSLKPWPRVKIAELLEKLAPLKPKKVVLDYVYENITDPDLKNEALDQRLANAIGAVPTYISKVLNTKAMIQQRNLTGSTDLKWIEPTQQFKERAAGIFFANIIDTGVVRNFNFSVGTDYRVPPIAQVLFGDEVQEEPLPKLQDMINYYGPPASIKNIPFYLALDPATDSKLFEKKFIFVGQQLFLGYDVRQRDTFMTPYGQYAAGVEIHATTASNILDKSWIRRLPPFSEIGILLALTLFSTYVVLTLRPTFALALMICAVPVWILSAYLMFRRALFFPGILVVVVAVPIAYALNILTVYIRKKRTDQILGID